MKIRVGKIVVRLGKYFLFIRFMTSDTNPSKRAEVREKISKRKKGVPRPDILGEKNPAKRPEVRAKISQNKRRLRREDK